MLSEALYASPGPMGPYVTTGPHRATQAPDKKVPTCRRKHAHVPYDGGMAHDTDPITYTFEGQTIVHDGRSITECHETVNALCRQAKALAPRAAEEALDTGNTNLRPIGPRQAKAWDLVAQAHAWNYIAGVLEEARDARNAVRTDDRGVRYVEAGAPIPASFVAPVICGSCDRRWDDSVVTSVTPAPSARCPFEALHEVAPEYRCPECDTYSGTFTQDDNGWQITHSVCGRSGSPASFTRGTPEYEAVYDHQEGDEVDFSDPDPTNAIRADWARQALDTFQAATGTDDTELEANLIDLITDLLHLARATGNLDADEIADRAMAHFSAEVSEEDVARIARLSQEDRP